MSKWRHYIVAAVIAGVTICAVPAAQAAPIVYKATAADADAFAKFSGGHALWLPQVANDAGGSNRYVFENNGTLTVDGSSVWLQGTIHAIGTPAFRFQVDIHWNALAAMPPATPKKELKDNAYVPVGPVDPATWTFYNMDEANSTLTGLDAFAGSILDIFQYPLSDIHPLQIGFGANNKNILFGASAWIIYTVRQQPTNTAFSFNNAASHQDININLVPEPGTLGTLAAGLGFMAFMGYLGRRRRCARRA